MQLVTSHVIHAPLERVFEMFSDIHHSADLVDAITRVEVLTTGSIGKGTRFRETRVMFKRETTEEMEVTAFDPPHSYTVEADSCGAHFTSTFRFEPVRSEPDAHESTRVMLEITSKLREAHGASREADGEVDA